jgi:hypothetical protein
MVTRVRAAKIGVWAAMALTAVVGLSACGSADESLSAGSGEAGQEAPETGQNTLDITVTDGSGTVTRWTLTCDEPPGGSHPDPAGACAALAAHPEALKPVPADTVCTMQYGGDDKATVVGSYQGEKVDASFNLSGGCEIARWKSLVPLLPAAAASGHKSLNP